MTPDDARPFATFMAELGEVYGEEVSVVRARLYFEALSDLPIERVRAAAAEHVKASRFFPRPSDLRELVAARAERPVERPALYPHLEPMDPAVFKGFLAETMAKLGAHPSGKAETCEPVPGVRRSS